MRDTLQYIFDYSAEFLMEQGCKSIGISNYGTTECMYNGPNGLHCAVGCLLKDGEASQYEYQSSDSLPLNVFREEFLIGINDDNRGGKYANLYENPSLDKLLCELQEVHDSRKVEDWAKCLIKVASRLDLDPGILVTWID